MKGRLLCSLVLYLNCASVLWATGPFENLDFEQATIEPAPVGGWTFPADPAEAFPGWTVGGPGTGVSYNDLSIGGTAIDLMGPEFPNFAGYNPLQGSYSVLLQYFDIGGGPPTLSQTGVIPVGTKSINFLIAADKADAALTLNGVNIPLNPISGGRLAGDISSFAGGVAQITFSTTTGKGGSGDWLYFDDVQFSPDAIPEPGSLNLLTIGVLGLAFWHLAHRRAA